MRRIAPLALTLTIAGALPAAASGGSMSAKGTPVVIVGEITSQPKDFGFVHEKKLQVSTSPSMGDHTLHLRGAMVQDYFGRERGISDLHDKMWVRAEGKVIGNKRIKVTKLEVIGNDRTAFERSIYFRPEVATGYMTTVASSVAGSRESLSDTMAEPNYSFYDRDVDMEAIGQYDPLDAGMDYSDGTHPELSADGYPDSSMDDYMIHEELDYYGILDDSDEVLPPPDEGC
jgi:hypothetical protein